MATIGYGDISPSNTIERMLVIVLMFVAAGINALLINDVS